MGEIIIDGVDVSGCRFLKPTLQCEIQQVFQRSEILGIIEKPYGAHLKCELSNPDCYYKQLQRKTQKCERYYNEWITCLKQLDAYKQIEQQMQEKHYDLTMENQQLKEDLTTLQQTYEACEKEYKALNEKYIKVLELSKKGVDSYEYCIRELEKENEELKIQISSLQNHISQLLEEKEDEANLSPMP